MTVTDEMIVRFVVRTRRHIALVAMNLSINYLFFGARRETWRTGLGALWSRFWDVYLAGDQVDVCAAIAPFFAWRALVCANPQWYPHLTTQDRDRILGFAERVLAADRFDPAWGSELWA